MELKEKVALITGGLSGLGAATAHRLSEQGMKVAIINRESQTISSPPNTLILPGDVTDSQAMEQAVNEIVKHFAEIHVCINCAQEVWRSAAELWKKRSNVTNRISAGNSN